MDFSKISAIIAAVLGVVSAVEEALDAADDAARKAAVVQAAQRTLQAVEGFTGRDLLTDTDVVSGTSEVYEAVVAVLKVIRSRPAPSA